jgi:protein gp37
LTLPMRWRKPALIFASSTSDFFHERLSDQGICRLFAVMACTPQHTYQVLTKRSWRMRVWAAKEHRSADVMDALSRMDIPAEVKVAGHIALAHWPLPNVWLGVSVEDQQRADERREDLRNTPAAVRFVSYEPALGPVDWTGWAFVDWIISGGESGPRARIAHPRWYRGTSDFCASNDVAYLHKQNGMWIHESQTGWLDPSIDIDNVRWEVVDGESFYRVGKKAAGRLLDGVQHDGFPK